MSLGQELIERHVVADHADHGCRRVVELGVHGLVAIRPRGCELAHRRVVERGIRHRILRGAERVAGRDLGGHRVEHRRRRRDAGQSIVNPLGLLARSGAAHGRGSRAGERQSELRRAEWGPLPAKHKAPLLFRVETTMPSRAARCRCADGGCDAPSRDRIRVCPHSRRLAANSVRASPSPPIPRAPSISSAATTR